MAFQTVFKRYELKYMLTLEQKEKILEAMSPYIVVVLGDNSPSITTESSPAETLAENGAAWN